jgi:hypothetical protein
VSEQRLSADGLFYWNGVQWVTTLSPDARTRWDGAHWVPVPQGAAPPRFQPAPMPVTAVKPGRVPTAWTRPLQLAVAGAFALWGLYSASVPFVMSSAMDGYMRAIALRQAQQAPQLYPDPAQYADMMSGIATASLVIGVVITTAIATVVVVGALRRWTWLFYVVLALLALQVAGLPFQIANAVGGFSGFMPAGTPALVLPSLVTWAGIVGGAIAIGLGGWMLVAVLTRGPWAMRRLSGAQ